MKPWSFPAKFDQLWKELTEQRQRTIIQSCATQVKKGKHFRLVDIIADRIHTRPQTIQKWPVEKFRTHFEKHRVSDDLTAMILFGYIESLDPLRIAADDFFDEEDVDENNCYFPEAMEESLADLLGDYDYEDVKLFAQFMAIAKIGHWSRIREIKFEGIESAMQASESGIVEREDEESFALGDLDSDGEDELLEEVDESDPSHGAPTEALEASLATAKGLFTELAQDLTAASEKYAAGILPDAGFVRKIHALRSTFRNLSRLASHRMKLMGIEAIPESPASLAVLETAVAEIKRAEMIREDVRKQIAAVLETLDVVYCLVSSNGRDLPALNNCRRGAADLCAKVLQNDQAELPADLLEEFKPYQAIAKMLNRDAALDDMEAADRIGTLFGAGFVYAIASGLIVRSSTPVESPAQLALRETSLDSAARPAPAEQTLDANPSPEPPQPEPAEPSEPVVSQPPTEESPAAAVLAPVILPAEREPAPLPAEEPVEAQTTPPTTDPLPASVETQNEIDLSDTRSEDAHQSSSYERYDGETAQSLALKLATESEPSCDSLDRLVWLAVREGKLSLAYQLATSVRATYQSCAAEIFPTRIRAVVLGQEISSPIGSISEQLKTDYSDLANAPAPESDELALGYRLLMIASALKPAVISPDTNAKSILELGSISLPRLDRLYWLCNILADYTTLQMPLDVAALAFIDYSASFSEPLATFQAEVQQWWMRAPKLGFKYAPAQYVWKYWLEPERTIEKLLGPALRNDKTRIGDVKKRIEFLSTDTKIRNAINSEDKQMRGKVFEGRINWNALEVLTRHVREAVDFASRWVALQEHDSSDQLDYRRKKLLELRIKLDSERDEIRAELEKAMGLATDIRVAAALGVCHDSFQRLMKLLHPKEGDTVTEPPVKYLLSSGLLMVPGLPMTSDWEPRLSSAQITKLLLAVVSNPSAHEWEEATKLLGENRRDHETVDRILEYLSSEGKHTELHDRIASMQESHLKQCQDSLVRQIEECTRHIEVGVSLGLVRDHERAEYLDRIHQISLRLNAIRNFEAEEAQLRGIVAAIDNSRMRQVDQVRARIESEGIQKSGPAFARIQAAIEKGDVDTANEYIDLTLHGDTLPDQELLHDSFRCFFPKAASEIEDFLSQPQNIGALIPSVESGRSVPGIDLANVPGAQLHEAVAMLEAWSAMKKTKRARQDQLKIFFERLGFTVRNVSDSNSTPRAVLMLDVVPLKYRSQCVIPYFGSTADGHYRLICIWDRPSEEAIIDLVRRGRQGPPAIVLYFGRMTDQKRNALAQYSRTENLTFILIDELLVCYLCGERGSRLPVLFDCALPFSFINPYTTTSSIVPPEMFYGRNWEREQITDPMGSCFVYGGRQLGKTALLLSIKGEFHNPAEQRIAVWIDLRSYGDDIWVEIARAFKELSGVDLQIGDARSEQKLIERLQAWLQADSKRRILLLLDESDRFLASDSEDQFRRTSSLKGLMERTNRRFKVVFAGLHNVQRTTKQQNHPLAHFGEPICVGPLLDRGEWKEAKALIERPLWSLGFRFESPDLVTRILSRTNYYPSLIQLYCNQIFQSVKADSACLRSGPSYTISAKHVEDAYSSRQFENAIRDKFELTLNLDLRYRMLALIIALNTIQGASEMPVVDIRVKAFNWWKLGFNDLRSEEDFRVLLEEMVGLGILREINGGFALRTPNLLSLLGRQEQIEAKLLELSYSVPPPVYAAHFHRSSDRRQASRRNPLSDQQHSELRSEKNSVSLVLGTKAAGIDDVEHFLLQSSDPSHYINCDLPLSDTAPFRKYLEDVRAKAQNGTTLVIVRNSPWSLKWIHEALAFSKGRTRFTSVVFIADPGPAWGLVRDYAEIQSLVTSRRLNRITLQPWHSSVLWQWLGDCTIGSNALHEQEEIGSRTGRWPMVLEQFRDAILSGMNWKAALNEVAERLEDPASKPAYLKAFGLDVEIPYEALSEMVSLGGLVHLDDLAEIMNSMPKPLIEDVFHWADWLGLIQPAPKGEWSIDPVVGTVLTGRNHELVDAAGAA